MSRWHKVDLLARFLALACIQSTTECWLWNAATMLNG
jgi:hypothetical protein